MKKILFYTIFFLWGMGLTTHSQGFEGLSLLISSGVSRHPTACGEMLLEINFQTSKVRFEPRVGLSYQPYIANFAKEKRLVHSIGISLGLAIYPCQKYFFTGIHLDLVSVNWFDKATAREIDKVAIYYKNPFYNPPLWRCGLLTGVKFNIGKRVALKAYTLQGIHAYIIAPEFIREDFLFIQNENTTHVKFMFQFNIGVTVHLTKKNNL